MASRRVEIAGQINGQFVDEAVAFHRRDFGDAFDVLRRLGGLELGWRSGLGSCGITITGWLTSLAFSV